ncbi:MAG: response regulator [Vulcanimicrobiota bacterium]
MVIRILLLEDDDTMRGLLAEALGLNGYAVTAVGSGAAAVEAARADPFDIMIADVRMEGMDGLAAVEGVQGHRPGIGSLVITGYSTEEDSIRAIRLGVGDYLKKPFQIKVFLEAVEKQAKKRQHALEVQQRERALQRTAAWAIESLAQTVVTQGSSLPESGRLVGRAAQKLGSAASDQLRLAYLIAAVQKAGLETPPFLLEGLPPTILHWVRGLSQSEPPGDPELELAWVVLNDAREGASPAVAQALERADDDDAVPASRPPKTGPSLFSLARTLEQAGELDSAAHSFQELAEGESPRLAVEGLLGLARLELSRRQPDRAAELAHQAVERSAALGPQTESEIALDASLILGRAQRSEAVELARRAGQLAANLGLDSLQARAQLNLAQLGDEVPAETMARAVSLLVTPAQLRQLEASVGWLLPLLLDLKADAAADDDNLKLLVREFPRELHGLIMAGEISTRGRRLAARLLNPWGGHWPEEALRHLSLDSDEEVRQAARQSLEQSGPATPPYLRVYSLGSLEVFRGDERIENTQWKSNKVRYFLAFLASHSGRPVAEEILLETFWPDDLERGRRNLSATLSHLRANLRPTGWKEELNYLVRTRAGLQFNPDLPFWHDLDELDKASTLATRYEREGTPESALRAYRRMAELYRGPYLDGYYEDWALNRRSRVERLLLHALITLARHGHQSGQPLEALDYAQRALELDPCSQEAYLYVVEANVDLNFPEEAIRQFEACKKLLHKELGVEPSIDLLRAHQKALLKC